MHGSNSTTRSMRCSLESDVLIKSRDAFRRKQIFSWALTDRIHCCIECKKGGSPWPTQIRAASMSNPQQISCSYCSTRPHHSSETSHRDDWTVFYWGWWISWAPFVGLFVAMISRGRSVRNVIMGAFFAPSLFSFLWFGVFGSLAIKMQRVAELTLLPE